MSNRYPIQLPNTPTFDVNDNATEAEQDAVFENAASNTGIVAHGYTGVQVGLYGEIVGDKQLVIDSSTSPQANPNPNIVIGTSNDLIAGGLGMPYNPLMNLPSSDGLYNNRPVWDYGNMEIVNALAIYQCNRVRILDSLNDIAASDEYDFFIIALPSNVGDATIAWKDTYRTQLSIPAESYLLMILAIDLDAVEVPNAFRLQIFDDGAGEYLFDTPFNSLLCSGSEVNIGNAGGAVSPFILPSPLAIVKPGLVTISLSNVNASNDEEENPIAAYIALVFAMPKKCRGFVPKANGVDLTRGLIQN